MTIRFHIPSYMRPQIVTNGNLLGYRDPTHFRYLFYLFPMFISMITIKMDCDRISGMHKIVARKEQTLQQCSDISIER